MKPNPICSWPRCSGTRCASTASKPNPSKSMAKLFRYMVCVWHTVHGKGDTGEPIADRCVITYGSAWYTRHTVHDIPYMTTRGPRAHLVIRPAAGCIEDSPARLAANLRIRSTAVRICGTQNAHAQERQHEEYGKDVHEGTRRAQQEMNSAFFVRRTSPFSVPFRGSQGRTRSCVHPEQELP